MSLFGSFRAFVLIVSMVGLSCKWRLFTTHLRAFWGGFPSCFSTCFCREAKSLGQKAEQVVLGERVGWRVSSGGGVTSCARCVCVRVCRCVVELGYFCTCNQVVFRCALFPQVFGARCCCDDSPPMRSRQAVTYILILVMFVSTLCLCSVQHCCVCNLYAFR